MKILVIQQKHIGDVLTSSILAEALSGKFPALELHYLVNSHTAPVLRNNPFIHRLVLFTPQEERSKRRFLAFLRQIRREKYDIVIDAYGKWSSIFITWFSKAPVRISYYKYYTWFFFTHTTPLLEAPEHDAKLAIENRLKLLEPLSVDFHPYVPKLYLSEQEKEEGKALLAEAGIDPKLPLFMIGALGSNAKKSYPAPYMASVLECVLRHFPQAQLLFNYAPAQKEAARDLYDLCGPRIQDRIFWNVFPEDLRQFMKLAFHCNAFIGNEGGAANMAKALNVPVFAIFSPFIGKEGWFSETEKPLHRAVHLSDYRAMSGDELRQARKDPARFYLELTPEKILPELEAFLESIR